MNAQADRLKGIDAFLTVLSRVDKKKSLIPYIPRISQTMYNMRQYNAVIRLAINELVCDE